MGQRGVLEIGVDLFDDGVAAVSLVGGDGIEVAGGEEGVEAPGVEQGALPGVVAGVEVGDAAHDQPARDLLGGLAGAERGESDLGDFSAGDPAPAGFVVDRVGVLDRGPGVGADVSDGSLDFGVQSHSDRHLCSAADRRGDRGVAVERRIGPQQRLDLPVR